MDFNEDDWKQSRLSKDIPFYMKEDLIQVHYPDRKMIMDIGWYPEWDFNWEFTVYLIRDWNWEEPLCKRSAKTIDWLKTVILDIVKNYNL